MKSRNRSFRFFNFVARAMRPRRAADVSAFLLAAAALGISAVPARAADNVTVYSDAALTTLVASGDTLADVSAYIQSGRIVEFSEAVSGTTLSFSGSTELTLQSDSDTVRAVSGTRVYVSSQSGTDSLTLKLNSVSLSGISSSAMFADTSCVETSKSSITLVGSGATIQDCSADCGGAIYAVGGHVSVSDTTFSGNNATRYNISVGGAIYANGGNVNLSGTTIFRSNHASDRGGAICAAWNDGLDPVRPQGGGVTIEGSATFESNRAKYGGAIYASGGVNVSGVTTFTNNCAWGGYGGAICADGDVKFSGDDSVATFSENTGTVEGETLASDVFARNVTITDAGTYSFGGGIRAVGEPSAGVLVGGNLEIQGGAHVTFGSGAVNAIAGDMTVSGSGTTVTFESGASGTIDGELTVSDGATAEIVGAVKGKATLSGGSTLAQFAGTIGVGGAGDPLFLELSGAGTRFTQSAGGTIDGSLKAHDGATAEISGTVTGYAYVWDGSTLTQSAGTIIKDVDVRRTDSRFVQNAGTVSGNVTIDGEGASFTQSADGVVSGTLYVLGGATAETAGTLDVVRVKDSTSTQTDGSATGVFVEVTGADQTSVFTQNAGTVSGDIDILGSGARFEQGAAGVVSGSSATLYVRGGATAETAGTLKKVVVTDSAFTQTGGSATSVSVSGSAAVFTQNGGTVSNVTIDGARFVQGADGAVSRTLTLKNGATAVLSGAVGDLSLASGTTATLGADMTFNSVSLAETGAISGDYDVTIGSRLTNTAGSISARNISLKAGLSGSTALTATGTLRVLGGTVHTSGAISAGATEISAGTLWINAAGADLGTTTLKLGLELLSGERADVALYISADTTADVVFAADAQNATATISGATLTGDVTLSGATNVLNLNNANITGALTATGGTLNVEGANTAGTVLISSGATVVADADATLTASVFTQEEGSTFTSNLELVGGTATIAGTVTGATRLSDGSTLTQTAGALADVELMTGARFVQTGGNAGAVTSWDCGVDVAGTLDSLTLHAVESDKGATVSGTVTGATSLSDGSTLTQTAGALASVSVDESNFIQNGGSAESVSVSGESSTATLGGTVKNLSVSAGTATLAADQNFETLAISGGAISGDYDVTVASAVADGAGTISAKNLSLNGLSGSTALTVTGTLTLNGTTNTSGMVGAGTLAVSGDATLSGVVLASATTVSGTLTLDANGNVGALNVAETGALRLGSGVSAAASGATVAGELALGAGSTLSVTGTDAVAVKSLTMNGGWLQARGDVTVASAIADGAGSVLGNNVTLNGASAAAGKTLSAVAYDTLTLAGETTGLLVSADERLVVTGTATLSDVYIGDYSARTAGATEISGTLTLIASDAADAEHVIGATTLKSGGTLNVNTDATADVVFADGAEHAAASISGATLTGNVTLRGATNALRLTDANITGTLTATGGTLNVAGANTAGTVSISDGATVVMGDRATLTAREFKQEEGSTFTGDLELVGGTATIAGTVDGDVSLADIAADTDSTLSATVTGGLSLDASTLTLTGGAVAGTTTLSNGSTLTQTTGTLGAVSVADSTFTQNGGSAESVSVSGESSRTTLGGTVKNLSVSAGTATLAADQNFETLAISGDGEIVAGRFVDDDFTGEHDVTVASAIVNGTGVIAAKNIALNGLSGSTALHARGKLTLAGATNTSGLVEAETLAVNGDATLSGVVYVADATTVSGTLTLNAGEAGTGRSLGTATLKSGGTLNVNTDATADVVFAADAQNATATISGATLHGNVTLRGATNVLRLTNAYVTGTLTVDDGTAWVTTDADRTTTLGNLVGAGTVIKAGDGALTLGSGADFAGTLEVLQGAATLRDGATFGGSLGFFSEGRTLTAGADSRIAGTLTLGAGTTLELGGRDAKATLSVGGFATGESPAMRRSASVLSASGGAVTVVHDVYSATEYDVLQVGGTGVDLSFATAVLRACEGLDELSLLNAPDGVTLMLVEGDVAHGYGAVEHAGFSLTNFALSADGMTVSLGLGANAIAAGIFPLETTADQRAVARAATRAGTASGYGAALNALTDPHETLVALDALGAGHAAAMMPAQIDGAWNRLRSVMNAAGTGARLGAETELAAWAQYVGSYTDVDSSRERASWTRRMHGAHVGVERAFASGWTAGAALGYEDSEQKIGGAKIEDDALSASFYARRAQGAFTQTAALSFARHDYETRRTVAFPGYAGRTSGDTHGFTAALSYEASYAFEVADWVKLSPTASVSAAWNTIDGWTESGTDASLCCDDQDALTVLAGVGGHADFEFENPFVGEAKTRVGAYALFTAEMGDRSCGVDAAFTDTGAGFTAHYDDPSRYALQLGVTASLPLSGNTALFGGVSTELREDETNLNANLGVSFTW